MPRVVPSQVVDLIDRLFPRAKTEHQSNRIVLQRRNALQLAALIDVVEQLPNELVVLDGNSYVEFVGSIAAIRTAIRVWETPNQYTENYQIFDIEGFRSLSPVTLIYQALSKCPDEFPTPGTAELSFIPDNDFRENLRRDISAVNSALSNGEWKAATVLAGSVTEALLLWALQQNVSAAQASAANLGLKADPNIEKWHLHEYIEVATDLKRIKSETATQCRLAKDFRNLIHPGLSQRLRQVCNRGTALSAVAAMEQVINNLTP